MEQNNVDENVLIQLRHAQREEITQYHIYERLSKAARSSRNRKVLEQIADDEKRHSNICIEYTCQDVSPNKFKVLAYYLASRIFGLVFTLKLIERYEVHQNVVLEQLYQTFPGTLPIVQDEIRHEKQLLDIIDDERLSYSPDIVRGMNVAIVETIGALAGLTFAFQDRQVVIKTIIIIGIIMSLSVMSTEYLATKSDKSAESPIKSLIYAGLANIVTIVVLLLPYILFQNIYIALLVSIIVAMFVIYSFSFYISIVKGISITKRFLEMAVISLGITALAFGVGLLARLILHIEVI
jgi:VIT1/CCC1 family predicted Fe2+/Mn2+ transporter